MPLAISGPVIAFYHYEGDLYTSFRDAPGHWTDPHLFATILSPREGAQSGMTCGLEGAAVANPVGWASTSSLPSGSATPSEKVAYCGEGLPDPQYPVFQTVTGNFNIDNIAYPTYSVELLGFHHMSTGVWKYGENLYLVAARLREGTAENTIVVLKAVAFDGVGIPTRWHACDLGSANEPHCDSNKRVALRWDGASSFFDLYGPTSFTVDASPRKLYTFDFGTETWGAPYGSVDPGAVTVPAVPVSNSGNTIFRFPNGDIGIVYHYQSFTSIGFGQIYYRLYDRASSSWGSEILLVDRGTSDLAGISTVIPDPGGESLHLFEWRVHQIDLSHSTHHGTYHIVEHDGTFHGGLFEFPVFADGGAGEYTGWGHGAIDGESLFIPRVQTQPSDGPSRPPYEVWNAPISGTTSKTFTVEHLMPPGAPDDAQFYVAYVARANGSYIIPPPPSGMAIFPQYIKSRNRFAH